jgi:hypothetical protein
MISVVDRCTALFRAPLAQIRGDVLIYPGPQQGAERGNAQA